MLARPKIGTDEIRVRLFPAGTTRQSFSVGNAPAIARPCCEKPRHSNRTCWIFSAIRENPHAIGQQLDYTENYPDRCCPVVLNGLQHGEGSEISFIPQVAVRLACGRKTALWDAFTNQPTGCLPFGSAFPFVRRGQREKSMRV